MTLVKSVSVPGYPVSIHSDCKKIYVGSEGQRILLQLDDMLSCQQFFINLSNNATSVQFYRNELYVWLANQGLICIYDLSGNLIRSWKHSCVSKRFNKLRVVSDRVVVSSAQNQALKVYDLQGQLMKQIKCPGISKDWKAMAVCGDDSVIVSDYSTSSVFRVNIDSGEVMWTSKHVQYSEGVVCYKNSYVLVTSFNTDTRIWILDAVTGMGLTKLINNNA